MTHGRAVVLMLLVTLLWSSAGVVTRHLDGAGGFELTFWRSAFNALALAVLLALWRGPQATVRALVRGGRALWLSGLCWCVMFTAFMVALSLTTVANVLITMATAPLLTALASRIALSHRIAARTWVAIVAAGAGIAWMFGQQAGSDGARHWQGIAVAFGVPVAAAINWTLLQGLARRGATPAGAAGRAAQDDAMLAAVLVGAVLSMLLTAPLAVPFQATPRDIALLALLGVFQLAVPCLLAVVAARALPAPEVSLLALLEVVLGVLWVWAFAGEAPTPAVLGGGLLVLAALAGNELLAMRHATA
jgi:drug/metabolite transporter (DMT)-like permease